jgi:hypothetical protein
MEKHLGTWEEFEAWIRETIGSDFRWRIRPLDNASNRKMIADLIQAKIRQNNGVFPEWDNFIEKVNDDE